MEGLDNKVNINSGSEQFRDFRAYLQHVLNSRCRENSQYSLRAFAKSLEVEPSALSKILNGKRSITPRMFERLSTRLNLSESEYEYYHPKNAGMNNRKIEVEPVGSDQFHFICDWYHYAILELTQVKGFLPESKWIAQTLGISRSQVEDAVKRLKKMQYLIEDDLGRWHDNSGNLSTTSSPYTTIAFRHLQKQILSMGIEAMDMIPMERRDQSSMTFAINANKLEHAKELFKKFRRELAELLQTGEKDEVYHFSMSFYPVTHLNEENKNEYH
jgi:transcriptional regulator with XRE-family HTH domain